MDIFEKLRLIKLTKENHQILLNSNDGFITNTSYNRKTGGAYKREYKISDGNLYIHEAKTTDKFYNDSWIATDKKVHQFLSKFLWKLVLDEISV